MNKESVEMNFEVEEEKKEKTKKWHGADVLWSEK